MPDAQPWTPWKEEETRMDTESREAFARQDRALERIDGKLDAIRSDASDHLERIAKVEEKATAAHRRLDEMKVTRSSKSSFGWKEWLAMFLAGGAGLGAAIKAFFFGDK